MISSATPPNQTLSKSFKQRKWFVDLSKRPDKYAIAHQEYANPFGYSDRVVPDTTTPEEGKHRFILLIGCYLLFRYK